MQGNNRTLALLERLVEKDQRYRLDAYKFVLGSLNYTTNKQQKAGHVSAQELLEGIKEFAYEQFGPLAKTVLEHWGIKRCEDFGEIVYNLVNKKILGKTENDKKEDFSNGKSFESLFNIDFK